LYVESSLDIDKIEICSITGVKLNLRKYQNNQIDVSNLTNGVYILNLLNSENKIIKSFKLLKQ